MAPASPPSASSDGAAEARPGRILAVDWLRGLAVVLMIVAHGYDAWLRDDVRTGLAYDVIRHTSGIPSRLFLFLVGVAAAIKFEAALGKGAAPAAVRADAAKRGLFVIGLAYLFRLQEYAFAGFGGGIAQLARVDILNCIGLSLLLLAAVGVPRVNETEVQGRRARVIRPRYAVALVAVALFVGLGPIIGPAHFPSFLPRPLTSYIGGQRPMAWFTIFPWGAWAFAGLAVGHFWLRFGRAPRTQLLTFVGGGLVGAAVTAAVFLVRHLDPQIIRYPSDLVAQLGPGSFFFRLGVIGMLAALAFAVTRAAGTRPSPLRVLGQSSLFVYWVHVDLCYGHLAAPLKRKLTIAEATPAVAGLIALMYGLTVLKARHGARAWSALRSAAQSLRGGRANVLPPA